MHSSESTSSQYKADIMILILKNKNEDYKYVVICSKLQK